MWYPTLPDLLGSARSMAASTLRKQGEMEGLLKLHTSSITAKGLVAGADGAPAWHIAKASLMKSRPPFADTVDAMIGFVATKSGGPEGAFLRYLTRWHNNFVRPSQRAGVPATLYTALASCPCQYFVLCYFGGCLELPWRRCSQSSVYVGDSWGGRSRHQGSASKGAFQGAHR